MKTRINLVYELAEVRDALQLVRVVCDEVRNEQLENARETLEAPRWCAAVTDLVIERLKLLGDCIHGIHDPRFVAAHFSKMIASDVADNADEVLVPWSPRRRQKEAADVLRRARRHRRGKRRQ